MKLITLKDIQSHLCRWVWQFHPSNNLELVPEANRILFDRMMRDGDWEAVETLPMRWFREAYVLEAWLADALLASAVARAWNTPKSAGGPPPLDGFIDLYALFRSIAHSVWTETEAPESEDMAYNAGPGEPVEVEPMTERRMVEFLFGLLDKIDTADDVAKENEVLFRNLVRGYVDLRFETGITTDGRKLVFPREPAEDKGPCTGRV